MTEVLSCSYHWSTQCTWASWNIETSASQVKILVFPTTWYHFPDVIPMAFVAGWGKKVTHRNPRRAASLPKKGVKYRDIFFKRYDVSEFVTIFYFTPCCCVILLNSGSNWWWIIYFFEAVSVLFILSATPAAFAMICWIDLSKWFYHHPHNLQSQGGHFGKENEEPESIGDVLNSP